MFGKIFLKEWRDNRGIFILAVLLLVALVFLSLTGRSNQSLYMSGMFLLLFLPFAALLIGSAGFSSEFRDHAWTYLFSRPVRKEAVWAYKYVSLLSILLVVLGLFHLAKAFVPGLSRAFQDLNAPSGLQGLTSAVFYVALPLLVFTMAYALSILSDKPYVIFVLTMVVAGGLAWVIYQYIIFAWKTYLYIGSFNLLGPLMAAGFILASIVTFARKDFSQPVQKAWSLTKLLVLFLACAFVVETFVIAKGNPFTEKHQIYSISRHTIDGNAYFESVTGPIVRYDARMDKVRKLPLDAATYVRAYSFGGGRMAFIKLSKLMEDDWREELCVANSDGTQERSLVRFNEKGAPFWGWRPEYGGRLSSNGDRVAFVASHRKGKNEPMTAALCLMNTDGTGIKSLPLPFYHAGNNISIIAWPKSGDSMVLSTVERDPIARNELFKINLDSGITQSLLATEKGLWFAAASPNDDAILSGANFRDEKLRQLKILDLLTLETHTILEAPTLRTLWGGIIWAPQGDKIVFSQPGELWVYSRGAKQAQKIKEWEDKKRDFTYDWLADGKHLVYVEGKGAAIVVLGEDYREIKRIKIPARILGQTFAKYGFYGLDLWGLDNKVLVLNYEGPLWRLDLKTEQWKKVY